MDRFLSILFTLCFSKIIVLFYSYNLEKDKVVISIQTYLVQLLGEFNHHLIQSQDFFAMENILKTLQIKCTYLNSVCYMLNNSPKTETQKGCVVLIGAIYLSIKVYFIYITNLQSSMVILELTA